MTNTTSRLTTTAASSVKVSLTENISIASNNFTSTEKASRLSYPKPVQPKRYSVDGNGGGYAGL